jgi:TRAP-type C4-dicarboxylate transport system substrate-binding protein
MLRLTGLTLACAGALAAGVALAPTDATAQNKMKCATAAMNDVTHEWCKRLTAALQEKTNGRIVGEVYPGGQLGDVPRLNEGAQLGTIEATAAPGAFFVGIEPRFQVLDAPGVIDSGEHFIKTVSDAAFRDKLLSAGEAKGLIGLSVYVQAPNSIVNKKGVRTLEDLHGLKIRVFGSPLQIEPMKALGAAPAPLPLGESLPALQTGAIDGSIGSQFIFTLFKYYVTAKYVTRAPFSYVSMIGFASKAWFDKLSAEDQKTARDVGHALDKDISEWSIKLLPVMEKQWTDNGGEIIDFSAADLKKMKEITEPVGQSVMKQQSPPVQELYELLLAAAKKGRA